MSSLMHEYIGEDMFRSISSKVFWDQLPVPVDTQAAVAASRAKWCAKEEHRKGFGREPLQPGMISSMEYEGWDKCPELMRMVTDRLSFLPNGIKTSGLKAQLLVCAGAVYHVDLQGWDNSLFVNWYLDGPVMDFVMPNAVIRRTIRPGDIVVFDPSEVHGLVLPGAKCIDAPVPPDMTPLPGNQLSFFLSLEFDQDSHTDSWFGISRGNKADLAAKGFKALSLKKEVNPLTGKWRNIHPK